MIETEGHKIDHQTERKKKDLIGLQRKGRLMMIIMIGDQEENQQEEMIEGTTREIKEGQNIQGVMIGDQKDSSQRILNRKEILKEEEMLQEETKETIGQPRKKKLM